MTKNIKEYSVMVKKCSTCPFNAEDNGRLADPELVNRIKRDVLNSASQICHHPRLSGKQETHLCRGARDFQIEIFYRLGFISVPTDDAWNEKAKLVLKQI